MELENKCLMVKVNIKKPEGLRSEFTDEVMGRLVRTHKLNDHITGLKIVTSKPTWQNHVGEELGVKLKLPEEVILDFVNQKNSSGELADMTDGKVKDIRDQEQEKRAAVSSSNVDYAPA